MNYRIAILGLFFGFSSWIAITGLWLEIPLLIQKLPEGWRLPSHLNILIQCANIGPILYWIAHRKRLVNVVAAIHIQMLFGIASCVALIFFWDRTFTLFAHEHSVILFLGTFGLALVDCTSSVTYLPFMARFDSQYMTPYLIGEGLSGFIPSMVALLQGVGRNRKECVESLSRAIVEHPIVMEIESTNNSLVLDTKQLLGNGSFENAIPDLIDPNFSVEIFLSSLLVTLMLSYLAFFALQSLPDCRNDISTIAATRRRSVQLEMRSYEQHKIKSFRDGAAHRIPTMVQFPTFTTEEQPDDQFPVVSERRTTNDSRMAQIDATREELRRSYYFLLALMGWNCFLTFGLMPSLQPFSSLPYGVGTLHYVVILSSLSYPAGCFLAMLVDSRSVKLMTGLTIVGTGISFYIIVCAMLSPNPFLVDYRFGSIAMIVAWVSHTMVLSYAKTMITLWIVNFNNSTGMFWVGLLTQFGAASGALITFVLINYTRIFSDCSRILNMIQQTL